MAALLDQMGQAIARDPTLESYEISRLAISIAAKCGASGKHPKRATVRAICAACGLLRENTSVDSAVQAHGSRIRSAIRWKGYIKKALAAESLAELAASADKTTPPGQPGGSN